MSFAENIVRSDVKENILVVIESDFFFSQKDFDEVVSGSGDTAIVRKRLPPGYRPIFFGYPLRDVEGDPITTTFDQVKPFTSSLSGEQWSFDPTTGDVYAIGIDDPSDDGEQNAFAATDALETDQNPILIRCSFNYAMSPVSYYIDPDDTTSQIVTYVPKLLSDISLKTSFKDRVYGRTSRFSAQIQIENSDGELNLMLRQGALSFSRVKAYRMSGIEKPENVAKLFETRADRVVQVNGVVSMRVSGSGSGLDAPFIPARDIVAGSSPRREAKLRTILGHARGVRLENVNYNATPSTSNNRTWIIRAKMEHSASFSFVDEIEVTGVTINGARTVVTDDDLKGLFRVGDHIRIKKGSNLAWRTIAKVDNSAGTLQWVGALGSAFTSPVEIFKYAWVERAYLRQGDNDYLLNPGDHFTMAQAIGKPTVDLTLKNNVEGDLSGATTLDPENDFVWGNFYGPVYQNYESTNVKIDAVNIGDTFLGPHKNLPAVAHPAAVIWIILFYSIGTDDADLDSFEDLLQFAPDEQAPCGVLDPVTPFASRRTCIEIINDICASYDLIFFRGLDGKFKILRASVGSGVTHTVTDSDIIGAINYDQDGGRAVARAIAECHYADITPKLQVPWSSGFREHAERSTLGGTVYEVEDDTKYRCEVVPHQNDSTTSGAFSELGDHPIGTNGPHRSANVIAQRAGSQRNIYKIRLPKRFSTIDFGDRVKIVSKELPGFGDNENEKEILCDVVAIDRFIDAIEVELEDRRIFEVLGRATYAYV